MSLTSSDRTRQYGTLAAAVLAIYWLGMFTATHWPQPPVELGCYRDKIVHAGIYVGFAILISLNWSLRRPYAGRQQMIVIGFLMLYAAFDELTQIPVGRHCDIIDWIADTLGTLIGIWLFRQAQARWSTPLS